MALARGFTPGSPRLESLHALLIIGDILRVASEDCLRLPFFGGFEVALLGAGCSQNIKNSRVLFPGKLSRLRCQPHRFGSVANLRVCRRRIQPGCACPTERISLRKLGCAQEETERLAFSIEQAKRIRLQSVQLGEIQLVGVAFIGSKRLIDRFNRVLGSIQVGRGGRSRRLEPPAFRVRLERMIRVLESIFPHAVIHESPQSARLRFFLWSEFMPWRENLFDRLLLRGALVVPCRVMTCQPMPLHVPAFVRSRASIGCSDRRQKSENDSSNADNSSDSQGRHRQSFQFAQAPQTPPRSRKRHFAQGWQSFNRRKTPACCLPHCYFLLSHTLTSRRFWKMPEPESRKPTLPVTVDNRLRGAIWGQFVGDAAALGTHWIYDLEEMAKLYPKGVNGFEAPHPGHYHYGKQPGDQTHYGEGALVLLESIAKEGQFDPKAFGRSFVQRFQPRSYSGYVDKATRGTLENYAKFVENNREQDFDFQQGADDDQLAGGSRLASLVA